MEAVITTLPWALVSLILCCVTSNMPDTLMSYNSSVSVKIYVTQFNNCNASSAVLLNAAVKDHLEPPLLKSSPLFTSSRNS